MAPPQISEHLIEIPPHFLFFLWSYTELPYQFLIFKTLILYNHRSVHSLMTQWENMPLH